MDAGLIDKPVVVRLDEPEVILITSVINYVSYLHTNISAIRSGKTENLYKCCCYVQSGLHTVIFYSRDL